MAEPTDDGRFWGWMDNGVWRRLPKMPMLLARLGPPPFHLTLPNGEPRYVVHDPDERLP
jgi:hypothetical protein